MLVHFNHGGKEYEKFDATRPYFVVRGGKLESCHERYSTAYSKAGYSGYWKAGRAGSPVSIVTNAWGLAKLGIPNPIPKVEP